MLRFAVRSPRPAFFAKNSRPHVVAIAVSDTGIGISWEKQQLIFVKLFSKLMAQPAEKYGGTGTGSLDFP